MSDICIGESMLEPYEWDGKRVVTFEQIAQVHGVPTRSVQRNYREHSTRFTEGDHLYRLDFAQSQTLLKVEANPNGYTGS